jgi:hypothetical protein
MNPAAATGHFRTVAERISCEESCHCRDAAVGNAAQEVEATPDKQISLTDPDARSIATSGKGTGTVG